MHRPPGGRWFRLIHAIAALFVGFGASILPGIARAVDADQELSQLHHTAWTTREGGPGIVWALAQTPDGILWVGTGAGLYTFDGVSFERFAHAPAEPSLTGDISALYAAPNGDLWIGTRLGAAYVWRGGHLFSFEGLPKHTVFDFARDFEGRMWAATTVGLFRLDAGRWQQKSVNPGATSGYLQHLMVDRHGAIWVAGSGGVFYLPRGSDTFVRARTGTPPLSIFLDQTGEAWVCDVNQVAALTGPERSFLPTSPNGRSPFDYIVLGIDREGTVWTSDDTGIGRIGAESLRGLPQRRKVVLPVQRMESGRSLSGHVAQIVFEDREGNVWVGTSGGLDRFRSNKLTRRVEERYQMFSAAIAPARDGGLWVGTDQFGLLKLQSSVKQMNVLKGLGFHTGIMSLDVGADGVLWMGGRSELWRSTQTGFARVELPFGDPPTPIQAIATDTAGGLWISTSPRGMWRLLEGRWAANGGVDGLPAAAALSIAADSAGGVWFGYPGGGVALVVQGRAQRFGAADGVSVGDVSTIRPVGDGVWFGGSDGVMLYRHGHFQPLHSTQDDALAGISGITSSTDGDLWFNGVTGVVRVPAAEVEAFVQDTSHRVVIEVLNSLDGLDGIPQQLRPLDTAVRSTDGRLWFATTQGLFWIDPRRMHRNALAPSVFIRSINLGDVQHAAVDGLALPERTTSLDIDYTATSLTMPERVRFRYRLDGIDSTWQDAAARRRAWYTNLSPGTYRFHVIACNEDGVWNSTGASVGFTIVAAFYQTAWFYALCCIAGMALVWAAAMLRLRQLSDRVRLQLEARSRERERIARELHDTMLQGTQGLVLSFQVLADQLPPQDAMRMSMEGILDQADEVIAQARDSVMALRSADARQSDIRRRLQEVAAELSASGGIAPTIVVSGPERRLSAEALEEAFRIGREALLNAYRHAQARVIEIQLSYGAKAFRLSVRDDGIGIDAATVAAGARPGHWGLTGMRERALRIDATLALRSAAGSGTEIELRVPASRAYAQETSGSPWLKARWLIFRLLPSKKPHDDA